MKIFSKGSPLLAGIKPVLRRFAGEKSSMPFSLTLLSGFVPLFVLLGFGAVVPAAAQTPVRGVMEAIPENGYARLVFRSDSRPDAAAAVSNGVLIVQFASPVDVDVDAIPAKLAHYVTAAKLDPDGTALRLALSQKLTANVMPLGNALYIDLLPQGWRGFPPPLPVAALTEATVKSRRLAAVEEELERLRELPHKPLQLSTGTHPTFYRLSFAPDRPVGVEYGRQGKRVSIRFNANITVDATPLRSIIPDALSNLDVAKTPGSLTISFDVPEANTVRHFEEEGGVILDIQRPQNSIIEPAAPPEPAQSLQIEPRPQNSTPPNLPALPNFPQQDKPPSRYNSSSAPEVEPAPDARLENASYAPGRAGGLLVLADAVEYTGSVQLIRTSTRTAQAQTQATQPQPPAASGATIITPRVTASDAESVSIFIPQATMQPSAAFARDTMAWIVLDGVSSFNADALTGASNGLITGSRIVKTPSGAALVLSMKEAYQIGFDRVDGGWRLVLTQNAPAFTSAPVMLSSGFTDRGLSFLQAAIPSVGSIQKIQDPVVGDELTVVTAGQPVSGVANGRNLLELNILPSAQGFVLQARADDVTVRPNNQGVMVTRPDGLSLSVFTQEETAEAAATATPEARANPFTNPVWQTPSLAFAQQQDESLLRDAANAASMATRTTARLNLGQSLLAHGDAADAKAVFDMLRADVPSIVQNSDAQLLYATTLIQMRQFPEALAVLKTPALANNPIAALWQGVAEYNMENIGAARENFVKGQEALSALPDRLQKIVLANVAESALDAKDAAAASAALEALRILPEAENDANVTLLSGRVAEAMNKPDVALEIYDLVAASRDDMAAAKAQLHATQLRLARNAIDEAEATRTLESLSIRWRGDAVEEKTLAELAKLYVKQERWRDALTAMRTAMFIQPEQDTSRTIHTTMSELFSNLFSGEGDNSAPLTLDSVALFYDFKDLVPPGAAGDVMIRQLADRLTGVDLLAPAANLLEYQINNRLTGAARSQVAAQAAMLHIMNHNPNAAYSIIQTTRQANLPADLVRNRFILEARALSEMGRTDLALDMINGYEGQDVTQLRADILWHSERWQQAAESFELAAGERWKDEVALEDMARKNIMRAAIAYVRANDQLGLQRLRARYLDKMESSNDGKAFDVVTAPVVTPSQGEAFKDIVRAVAAVESLNSFLEEYKKLTPETAPSTPPAQSKPEGNVQPAAEQAVQGT